MSEEKRIIEINGIKLEADLRSAKVVETYKVGDNVKVLDKRYTRKEMKTGTIIDFADFGEEVAIILALFKEGDYFNAPTVEFVSVTENSDDYALAPIMADELKLSRDSVVEKFNYEIKKAEEKLDDLKLKKEIFIKYFGNGRA